MAKHYFKQFPDYVWDLMIDNEEMWYITNWGHASLISDGCLLDS
jgi:hypothetical protein